MPVEQPAQPSALPAPAVATADNTDGAKVAEFQKRFQEGYALQQDGKLADARKIYDSILAEQPEAKRSLLEAGRISFKLGELARANDYLSKLHEIVPDFPEATELLIQINQALKHDVKVELLLRDFRQLHDSGKIPELTNSLCFVRERITDSNQVIVISQFFDYRQSPNTVYMAEVFDLNGLLQRRILLNYDDGTTKALRAKDAKYATTEVFTWFEHKLVAGKVTEIDAYLQVFALPDYKKFRSAMFVILANPPKPIYSAPVGGTQ
jgi:tetratricopeptide (TPR) repeat protein